MIKFLKFILSYFKKEKNNEVIESICETDTEKYNIDSDTNELFDFSTEMNIEEKYKREFSEFKKELNLLDIKRFFKKGDILYYSTNSGFCINTEEKCLVEFNSPSYTDLKYLVFPLNIGQAENKSFLFIFSDDSVYILLTENHKMICMNRVKGDNFYIDDNSLFFKYNNVMYNLLSYTSVNMDKCTKEFNMDYIDDRFIIISDILKCKYDSDRLVYKYDKVDENIIQKKLFYSSDEISFYFDLNDNILFKYKEKYYDVVSLLNKNKLEEEKCNEFNINKLDVLRIESANKKSTALIFTTISNNNYFFVFNKEENEIYNITSFIYKVLHGKSYLFCTPFCFLYDKCIIDKKYTHVSDNFNIVIKKCKNNTEYFLSFILDDKINYIKATDIIFDKELIKEMEI